MLTRRKLLSMAPAGLLSLGLWPGALSAADKERKEIRFAVFNDLHVHDRACGDWLAGVVKGVKEAKERPAFVILNGDLAEHGTAKQLTTVRDVFKTLGVPVHVTLGNHDWRTNTDRKSYNEAFPKSLNYTFDHEGWQFVGLDSSHGLRSKAAVQPATLTWLDDNLGKLDRKKPLVVFTHFPMGPKVTNRATNADVVLDRLKPFNLRAVFGGHHHAFTERTVGAVVMTTNRCCSKRARNHDKSKEKGYFLCATSDGDVTRTFVEVK